MGIFQILGCGFLTLVLWLVLQQYKSNFSVFVVIAFGIVLFFEHGWSIAGAVADIAAAQ